MASTMKAAVKLKPAPKSTEIRTVPIPSPGPTEVLIRVKVASICGTDVHIYDWDAWAQAGSKCLSSRVMSSRGTSRKWDPMLKA